MTATVGRADVLTFRARRHQLDREPDAASGPTHVDLLDYGIQDTGGVGAAWALALRGASPAGINDLAYAWTLRGAPHAYRRTDLADMATATAPWSDADAAKRIFDASKPLKAAGIAPLEALAVMAGHMREIVDGPMAKGDLSGRLADVLDPPYLRYCRVCEATHPYEQTFRLAALQAGLELEAGTSPPVLHPAPGLTPPMYRATTDRAADRFDVLRNYLRFFGPARMKDAAAFVDAPVREVRAHWPEDVVEVTVAGDAAPSSRGAEARFVLAADVDELTAGGGPDGLSTVRLLGSHDPYVQLRDRELLVADERRRKELWRTLGRPGAVVAGGEVIGTWRPRASGRRLTVRVQPWRSWSAGVNGVVEDQAERLAVHRDLTLAAVTETE